MYKTTFIFKYLTKPKDINYIRFFLNVFFISQGMYVATYMYILYLENSQYIDDITILNSI